MRILRGKMGIMNSVGGAAAAGGGPPVVTPATLPDSTYGNAYSGSTIVATGGTAPYTFAVTSGSLPTGISLSSGGVLSGTPSAWIALDTDYVFEVTATDDLGTPSAPVEFTLTVIYPTVFNGLLWGVRATDYTAGTGTATCFNNPSTLQFTQASGGARPSRSDTGAGPKMVFAGSQNIIANNAVENTFDALDDFSLLLIVSNDADALVWWFGARNPTTNNSGAQLNTLTDGAGVYRIFEYRNGTSYIGRTDIPRWGTDVGTIGFTTKRNTASQQVGWKGDTSYTGTATIPNTQSLIGSNAGFEARIGAAADGSFGCSGNIHAAFFFNKALNATEMQAFLEYLEDQVFWGTDNVTLW